MSGFATVVSRVRGDLDRGTEFDARIKQALESAIQFYRARRYAFNTRRQTIILSDEYTSLSADILEIDYLKIRISNYQKPLIEESYLILNDRMRDTSLSDEPVYFAVTDRTVRTYPPPDQSYSAEIHFLIDYREISASASDSASNAWVTEGQELIRLHAMVEILETYIDGPEAIAKADRLRLRENQVETELKRRANREQSSGSIKGVM